MENKKTVKSYLKNFGQWIETKESGQWFLCACLSFPMTSLVFLVAKFGPNRHLMFDELEPGPFVFIMTYICGIFIWASFIHPKNK